MSQGGKRENSGRKRIGTIVNIRIEEEILNEIETEFEGKSRAEKIRACLKNGLKKNNQKK